MISIEKEIALKFPQILTAPTLFKKPFIKFAKSITHEKTINNFLEENSHLVGFEFVDAVIEYFDFDYICSSKDFENIPTSGKVIIIANHPLGALDAMVLLKLISKARKDIRIVANDFLQDISNLQHLVIPINNFKKATKESLKPIYDALNHEMAVIIFPSGEVSRMSPTGIKDGKWHKGFINFAQKTNAPILPIFIGGKNSKTFYMLSLLNKTFSTLLLSNEMFKQQSKKIQTYIGELIPSSNIAPKNITKDALPTLYKKHVYSLCKPSKKRFFECERAIAHPEDRKILKAELTHSKLLGQTADNKKIYLYSYHEDSVVLREIGRLREISFRKVGEGVNKKRDTDKYDKYYDHIILWDENDLEIVGSYRIGESQKIYAQLGYDGFYSHTLFTFNQSFIPYLKNSIELGRSFVQPKYWGSRALDYLWYGIGAYLAQNPNIKYMFGPVSLSSNYPLFAQSLLIYFYELYFANTENLVNATTPFNAHHETSFAQETSKLFVKNDYQQDFKTLKKILASIGFSVPTLYKQYTEITHEGGSTFLGFNIDPLFNNCIDGFILVDVEKIKENQRNRYIPSTKL